MFTGIVTHTGVVATASRGKFSARAPRALLRRLALGGSISVDGACLTVIAKTADSFSADLMPETARITTLGSLARGSVVNLELPATPATFLSGHLAQGHVDGTGTVQSIRACAASRIISVALSRKLMRFVVPKGSVAINGVSLTVMAVSRSGFTVGVIPHTWNNTSFSRLSPGDAVNIETDILAKYAEKIITAGNVEKRA